MKIIIIFCLILISTATVFSSEATDKLLAIQQQQQKNILAQHKLRVKLIKKDQAIKQLHQRIMVLHKELAIKINATKAMRSLIAQQKHLEAQLARQKAIVKQEQPKQAKQHD